MRCTMDEKELYRYRSYPIQIVLFITVKVRDRYELRPKLILSPEWNKNGHQAQYV